MSRYAVHREVVPAGSSVTGKVSQVQPVAKQQRFRAILNGDFTGRCEMRGEFWQCDFARTAARFHSTLERWLNSIYTETIEQKKGQANPRVKTAGFWGPRNSLEGQNRRGNPCA